MKKVKANFNQTDPTSVYHPKERYGASGYGVHADRRTKRNRSRNDQRNAWKKEWSV